MGVPDLGIGMQLVCGSFVVVNVDLIHDWSAYYPHQLGRSLA